MASKMITDRQKGAEAVAAIVEAQGKTLAEALGKSLDGSPQEVLSLMGQLRGALLASRDAMVAADAEHEREMADDPSAREERDGAAVALTTKLVELREVVTGLYGGAVARQLMPSATPEDPVVLTRFAGEVAEQLVTASLPAPRVAGAALDLQQLAGDLAANRTYSTCFFSA